MTTTPQTKAVEWGMIAILAVLGEQLTSAHVGGMALILPGLVIIDGRMVARVMRYRRGSI